MPLRRALPLAVVGLVLCAGTTNATADPLVDARQRAEQLRVQVADLEQRTDTAVEDYDGALEELAATVTTRFRAEADLEAARDSHAASAEVRTARVRRLYELGGPAALYGGLLRAQSPTEALRGVQLAQRLLGMDGAVATVEAQTGQRLEQAASAAAAVAEDQVRQTQRVDALVGEVQGLLAQQQALLSTADADVVRIAQEQAAERERQAQAAFAAQLAAAQLAADQQAADQQAAERRVLQAAPGLSEARGSGSVMAFGATLPASQRAGVVIAAARAQLGKPYVWGATGPGSFDCSGLTRWAYAAAGVGLPRTSRAQWGTGPHPSLAELAPGDLLFWGSNPRDPSTIHHVAIYLGGGDMIAAPHTGTVVKVQRVYANGYVGATRVS